MEYKKRSASFNDSNLNGKGMELSPLDKVKSWAGSCPFGGIGVGNRSWHGPQ